MNAPHKAVAPRPECPDPELRHLELITPAVVTPAASAAPPAGCPAAGPRPRPAGRHRQRRRRRGYDQQYVRHGHVRPQLARRARPIRSRATTSSSAAAPASSATEAMASSSGADRCSSGRSSGRAGTAAAGTRASSAEGLLRDANRPHLRRQEPPGTRGHRRTQEARERRPRLLLLTERRARLVSREVSSSAIRRTRTSLLGKRRYTVPTPTRARRATSSIGAPYPSSPKTSRAARSTCSRLRCASTRSGVVRDPVHRTAAVAARCRADRATGRDGRRGRPMSILNVHKRSPVMTSPPETLPAIGSRSERNKLDSRTDHADSSSASPYTPSTHEHR